MSMSKDRVRFKFTDNQNNKDACIQAAVRAFGMERHEACSAFNTYRVIVCRPSQFARFIIYRSEMVSNNAFAQFGAELFTPEPPQTVIDVSVNPREVC
jgi:hypothetical protein